MRKYWMTTAAVMTLALCGSALAQVADDAKAVLVESAKAVRSAQGLEFSVKKSATGMLKDIIDSDGKVKLWRPAGATTTTWMVEGRVKQPGKPDKKIVISTDGTKATWLNYEDNTMYERPVTDAMASQELNLAQQIMLSEWTMATPFQKEMTQFAKLSKTGIDNINGVVCDIVEAQPAGADRNFTWAIGVADKLPRKLEMGTGAGNPDQRIAMITEMKDLKPVTFTAKDFDIAMPAGFTLSKMQAPVAPTAPNTPVVPVELGLKPGTQAPSFAAKTSAGSEITSDSIKGNVAVLEFWGTMFKSSTANAAEMKELSSELGDRAKFIAFACREMDDKRATDWWSKSGLSYPMAPKGDEVAKMFKVSGYPSYYVVGKDGNIAAFFQDYPGKDRLRAAIEEAGK